MTESERRASSIISRSVLIILFLALDPDSQPVRSGAEEGYCVHHVGTGASENRKNSLSRFSPNFLCNVLFCQNFTLKSKSILVTFPKPSFFAALNFSGKAGEKIIFPCCKILSGTAITTLEAAYFFSLAVIA